MYYIVYKTTCLINNKIYIGVHKTETPEEFDGYIGCGISKNTQSYLIKHPRTPLHFALRKYGITNFERETLYVFEKEDDAYEKEKEIVNEDFINSSKTYNATVGGKGGNNREPSVVFYFNKEGKLMGSFNSALEAAKSMECVRLSIDHAIKFKVSVNNYFWSRSPVINTEDYNIIKKKTYYIYKVDGSLVAENVTKDVILLIIDTTPTNFNRTINCLYPVNGYIISLSKIEDFKVIVAPNKGKKLNRYSLDGFYIDSFDTVLEAKIKLGLSLNNISAALKSRRVCNGFYWTREDNPESKITVRVQNKKKQIIVEHIDTKQVEIFESVREVSKKYKSARYILAGRCNPPHNLKFSYKN